MTTGSAGTPKHIAEVRVWVDGYGPLTPYEAQRKAVELWDSLPYRVQRAVERSGVDSHICTVQGAEGLIALRAALVRVGAVA